MGIPAYDYSAIAGCNDYLSLMNNPYFQQAYMSKNVNFTSNKDQSSLQIAANKPYSISSTVASDGAIPVTSQPQQQSGSGVGTVAAVGTTIVVGGGALYMLKKGQFGKLFSSLKSKVCANGFTENANAALQKLTATKVGNRIKFMMPGNTTTVTSAVAAGETQSGIQKLVNEYGIQGAISAERQGFKPAKSVIKDFECKVGDEIFTIHVEDGVVKRIVDKDNKEVLQQFVDAEVTSTEGTAYQKIQNAIKEFAKEKDVDTKLFEGISNIHYTNTYGDDVLKMSQSKYGENPLLEEFTTLQRFDFDHPELQAYVLKADEKVFANQKFLKDGKLIDGLTVSKFSDKIGGGYIGNFEGETLVSVVRPDGIVLPAGSAGYENIVTQYEKDIDKLINKVFYKRNYIPDGAIITTG